MYDKVKTYPNAFSLQVFKVALFSKDVSKVFMVCLYYHGLFRT